MIRSTSSMLIKVAALTKPVVVFNRVSPRALSSCLFIKTEEIQKLLKKDAHPKEKLRILSFPYSIMRANETNSAIWQPVLDIQYIITHHEIIQTSVDLRGFYSKYAVKELENLYRKVKRHKEELDIIEAEKKENTAKFADVKAKAKWFIGEETENELISKFRYGMELPKEGSSTASEADPNVPFDVRNAQVVKRSGSEFDALFLEIQAKGRQLRDKLREAQRMFNDANDELVEAILRLPNVLDHETPHVETQVLKQNQAPACVTLWELKDYVQYSICDYAPRDQGYISRIEIPMYHSAADEMTLSVKAQGQLLSAGFTETGTADTIRKSVLHSIGENSENFLRIREVNAKTGEAHATYVTGAASLPSLLMLHAMSLMEPEQAFPLRHFVIGRNYSVSSGIATHNCVVSCLVACPDEESMNLEFNNLVSIMEDFYATKVGIPQFQTQVAPATLLATYESKKYSFIMNKIEEHPSRFLGDISIIGDHLSKRLLCCYKDENGNVKMMHLVYARFFHITNFLRSKNERVKPLPSTTNRSLQLDNVPPAIQ